MSVSGEMIRRERVGFSKQDVLRMFMVVAVAMMFVSFIMLHGCLKKAQEKEGENKEMTTKEGNVVNELNEEIENATSEDVNISEIEDSEIDMSLFE